MQTHNTVVLRSLLRNSYHEPYNTASTRSIGAPTLKFLPHVNTKRSMDYVQNKKWFSTWCNLSHGVPFLVSTVRVYWTDIRNHKCR